MTGRRSVPVAVFLGPDSGHPPAQCTVTLDLSALTPENSHSRSRSSEVPGERVFSVRMCIPDEVTRVTPKMSATAHTSLRRGDATPLQYRYHCVCESLRSGCSTCSILWTLSGVTRRCRPVRAAPRGGRPSVSVGGLRNRPRLHRLSCSPCADIKAANGPFRLPRTRNFHRPVTGRN